MAEVIGAAFLGITRFVKDNRGEEFLKAVIEEAGDDTQKVFARKILIIGWYPYPAYIQYIRTIAKNIAGGDLVFCRKLGEAAAKRDIETIYSIYKEQAKMERMVTDADIVWKSYYKNAGHWEVVSTDPSSVVVRIVEFPDMDPAHCRLMEGWMTQMMRSTEVKIIAEVRERVCPSSGGPYHEFHFAYSK